MYVMRMYSLPPILTYVKATTYTEWHGVAIELDRIEGNEDWKITLDSPDYDYALIESKLIQLDRARASCDVKRILFLIRTSLSRNLGDMGNIKVCLPQGPVIYFDLY